jgi:hypothetical protein
MSWAMKNFLFLLSIGLVLSSSSKAESIQGYTLPKAPSVKDLFRGPRGKRGPVGDTGPAGTQGSNYAPLPGTLTVQFQPQADPDSTGTWEALLISPAGTIVDRAVYDVTVAPGPQTLTATSLTAGRYTFVMRNIDTVTNNPGDMPGSNFIRNAFVFTAPYLYFVYSIPGQDNFYVGNEILFHRPYPGAMQCYYYSLYEAP